MACSESAYMWLDQQSALSPERCHVEAASQSEGCRGCDLPADFLHKFELPVKITFDDQMKVVMMKGRYPRIYNQFSGGERSRIDMSILLSFFNTSRIISNWSCNIIFIDELIDNGVDQSGIDQFLSTLYNIVNENKKNKLGIYIVSHKLTEPKIAISSVIKIDKKPGGFSTLEVK